MFELTCTSLRLGLLLAPDIVALSLLPKLVLNFNQIAWCSTPQARFAARSD